MNKTDLLEWKLLSRTKRGSRTIEVLAATCEDGIGVIARWIWLDSERFWVTEAIDTESEGGMIRVLDFHEGEPVPASPPLYLL